MKFAIHIATKNRKDDLLFTLEQVYPLLENPELNCVVFDDGWNDGTADAVRQQFPKIQLLQNTTSRGYLYCRNVMLNETQADIAISLDDDAHFLSKNIVHEELVSAINSVYQHNAYFSQSITERLSKIIAQKTTVRHHNASISFTEVEKQIIGLICKELTSKEIAGQLKIGKRTVESYRIRIMDKIGAKSLAGIITYAAGYLPKNQQIA